MKHFISRDSHTSLADILMTEVMPLCRDTKHIKLRDICTFGWQGYADPQINL